MTFVSRTIVLAEIRRVADRLAGGKFQWDAAKWLQSCANGAGEIALWGLLNGEDRLQNIARFIFHGPSVRGCEASASAVHQCCEWSCWPSGPPFINDCI